MILKETYHPYYCECYEVDCITTNYSSWEEYINLNTHHNEILFRFDICYPDELNDSTFILELHFGNTLVHSNLTHDLIKITKEDLPEIDLFLKNQYIQLLNFLSNCRNDILFATEIGVEENIEEYLNSGFDLNYNLIYSYHWIDQGDGMKALSVISAQQRHGRTNWVDLIKNIKPEEEEKLQTVIDNIYIPHLLTLWPEYSHEFEDDNHAAINNNPNTYLKKHI